MTDTGIKSMLKLLTMVEERCGRDLNTPVVMSITHFMEMLAGRNQGEVRFETLIDRRKAARWRRKKQGN